MKKASSKQQYSFGTITVAIQADGPVTRDGEFCDVLNASIAGVGEIEGLKMLDRATAPDGKGISQTLKNHFEMGDISFDLEVGFELATDMSLRRLNDIVVEIMALVWNAYASYLGTRNGLGTKPYKAVLASISSVLDAQAQDGHVAGIAQPGAARRSSHGTSSRPRQRAGARR